LLNQWSSAQGAAAPARAPSSLKAERAVHIEMAKKRAADADAPPKRKRTKQQAPSDGGAYVEDDSWLLPALHRHGGDDFDAVVGDPNFDGPRRGRDAAALEAALTEWMASKPVKAPPARKASPRARKATKKDDALDDIEDDIFQDNLDRSPVKKQKTVACSVCKLKVPTEPCAICTLPFSMKCAGRERVPDAGVFECDACEAKNLCHESCGGGKAGNKKADYRCGHCGRRYCEQALVENGQRRPAGDLWRCFRCEAVAGLQAIESHAGDWFLCTWKSSADWHASWVHRKRVEGLSKGKVRNYLKRVNDYGVGLELSHETGDEDEDDDYPQWKRGDARFLRRLAAATRNSGTGFSTVPQRVLAERPFSIDGRPTKMRDLLVKWRNRPYDESSWERAQDLDRCGTSFREAFDQRETSVDTAQIQQKRALGLTTRRKPFNNVQPAWFDSGTLRDYQITGIDWLRMQRASGTSCILADEMGLGKTIQSAGLIASLIYERDPKDWRPALVVAPLSTLQNWERELETWCAELHCVVLTGAASARDVCKDAEFDQTNRFHVCITSYETASSEKAALKQVGAWSALIVDEGHRLKSGSAGKLFRELHDLDATFRLLLTGTPLQNSLDELYHLLLFLDPERVKKECSAEGTTNAVAALDQVFQGDDDAETQQRLKSLRGLLQGRMLRRLKDDVLKGVIKAKKELVVRVELTPLQKKLYRAVLTSNFPALAVTDDKKKKAPAPALQNIVMQLRKVCNHAELMRDKFPEDMVEGDRVDALLAGSGKLALLDRMLLKLRDAKARVLLFSQMTRTLDVLEEFAALKRYGTTRLDGSTAADVRQRRIDAFNAPDSKLFLFLLSTRAGGLGVNLATANTVVIYDADWNPHNDLQALARAHRLGQRDAVRVYRFVCRATVEERIVAVAKRKLCLEHVVVSGGNGGSKNLSRAELDDVLRYGAAELFSDTSETSEGTRAEKYGDGNQTGKAIVWDDEAVSALLHREADDAPVKETRKGENNALSKLMDSFKVAEISFEDSEEVRAPEVKEFEGWERLLKPEYDKTHRVTQEILGKGKRERKQIKQGPVLAQLSDEDLDDDDDDFHHELHSEREDETPSEKAAWLKGWAPVAKCAAKILLYGLPGGLQDGGALAHERLELDGKTSPDAASTFKLCQDALKEAVRQRTENVQYNAEREPFDGDKLLRRVGFFALVERKLRRRAAEIPHSGVEFARDITEHYLGETHPAWTPAHDARLLSAVCCHGYGRFADIALEECFDLVPPPQRRDHIIEDSDEEDLREEYTAKDAALFYRSRVDRLERALGAEAQAEKNPHGGISVDRATPVVTQFLGSVTSAACPESIPVDPEIVEQDRVLDEQQRVRWETIRNVVKTTLKARQAYDGNLASASTHFAPVYSGAASKVHEGAPTTPANVSETLSRHAAARRCLDRADDRLDAVLAAEAALEATRREVALRDAAPDPEAASCRDQWKAQGWRGDGAETLKRRQQIRTIMGTEHLRRFGRVLLGGEGAAPAAV